MSESSETAAKAAAWDLLYQHESHAAKAATAPSNKDVAETAKATVRFMDLLFEKVSHDKGIDL